MTLHPAGSVAIGLGRSALAMAGFLVVYTLIAVPFARGLGMRQTLSEMNLPFFRRRGGGAA